MKNLYKAVTDFWHNKVLVPAESLVELTEAEVKYLRHAVEAVVAKVEKPVEVVKAAVEAGKAATKEDVKPDAKA